MDVADSSNVAETGLHYGMAAAETLQSAIGRLREIVAKIPNTASINKAMDLNSYAGAEEVQIANVLAQLEAGRVKVGSTRQPHRPNKGQCDRLLDCSPNSC